jgi:hypothetical protein
MALCNWTREPATPPPAQFTLTLTEAEAQDLRTFLNGEGELWRVRAANPGVYDIEDVLADALDNARGF